MCTYLLEEDARGRQVGPQWTPVANSITDLNRAVSSNTSVQN